VEEDEEKEAEGYGVSLRTGVCAVWSVVLRLCACEWTLVCVGTRKGHRWGEGVAGGWWLVGESQRV
jgi:hypothetical protein